MSALDDVCQSISITPKQTPADGKWYPTDATNKAPGNGNGRVKRFADDTGGMVMNWSNPEYEKPVVYFDYSEIKLNPTEKAERIKRAKVEQERAGKELVEERALAAKVAVAVWKVATLTANSVYFDRKQVTPTDTVKEIPLDELVKLIGYHPAAKGKPFTGGMVQIIPVSNGTGITTIEMIDENGLKAGLKNGLKKGCFWSSRKLPKADSAGLVIGISEGVATALTYSMASDNISIAALSCYQMAAVALYFRNRYPAARIEIVSDIGNGEQSAIEAARAVNGWLIRPTLADDSTGTDINDQHKESGLQSVNDSIRGARQVEPIGEPATDAGTATESTGGEWPEPQPIPECLPPVKQLDPAMIPAPFRGWLADIAHRMQAPIDFAATAVIVALGSVIGRGCGIYPKKHDNWLVVPNLYGGAVGLPSVMKTPTISEGMRHVTRLEIEGQRQHEKAMEIYTIDNEVVEIQKKAICERIKKVVKNTPSADVTIFKEQLAALQSDEPTRKRYMTQDGTVEKIGELLNENPRGILINRDELIGWFRSLDKAGHESDRGFYLEGWNGNGRYTYDRIGRGTIDIEALCTSIFGAVTPGPLADYIREATKGGNGADGLIQRFQVMVWPDTATEWVNIDRYPDTDAKNRAYEIFKTLSGTIPGAGQDDGAIPALRFSPDGQVIFDTWRHDLETRLRSDNGSHPVIVSHLAKYRSLMPSLALIFHLIEVADGTTEPGPVTDRAAIMAAAWCDYLESHAGRIYGAATSLGLEPAKEIIKHIQRREIQDGCTAKDIYRRHWSRLATPEEVKAGLDVLIENDWLITEKANTGGRPSEVIRLNPRIKLLYKFTINGSV